MSDSERGAEISAIVGELRAELDRLPAAGAPAGAVPASPAVAGRVDVGRMREAAAITADHPPLVRDSRVAPLSRTVKKAIRKSMRWYVERLAADVRDFAEAATATSSALADRGGALEARVAELEARLARLDNTHGPSTQALEADMERAVAGLRDRLGRLERSISAPAPAPAPRAAAVPSAGTAPATPAPPAADGDGPAHPFDYFAFESLMRGSRELIAHRQEVYLAAFAGTDDILDVGCGRGEFLGLLRDAGKRARGIDVDADMVGQCVAEGLDAEVADAVTHLRSLEEGALGGVFASQVVEHLPPAELVAFLAAAHDAVRPGGTIVLETINPASLSALVNYFADLTHAQPLVPATLRFLVESAGFADARVELRSPVPDEGRLQEVPFGVAIPDEALATSRRNVELLNAILFAPQDYSVTARR